MTRMSKANRVLEYLKENFNVDRPILRSEIRLPDMTPEDVTGQLKQLTNIGRIKRFYRGVYYLPTDPAFNAKVPFTVEDVLKKKYLRDEYGCCCGYLGGVILPNRLGITNLPPLVYEVYTNKAKAAHEETRMGLHRVIVHKPYCKVNNDNVAALQFLDMLKDEIDYFTLKGDDLTNRLLDYMKEKEIDPDTLEKYLPYYPRRIYENLFKTGLMEAMMGADGL